MNKYILLLLLPMMINVAAAQEIEIDLDNFSEVQVTRGLAVEFSRGESNRAVISGNSREEVNIRIERGRLIVSSSLKKLLHVDDTRVKIYYRQMQYIDAAQNSRVEFLDRIEQPIFKLRAREGAEVIANIDVEDVVVISSTGGKLTISGTAQKQDIDVKAAGEFYGENLTGNNVNVNVTGGGVVNVFSNGYINAFVRGGSNLYIYGQPEKIDEKTSFGGSITRIN